MPHTLYAWKGATACVSIELSWDVGFSQNPMITRGAMLAARERIVGWYSTGPKLRGSDLDINDLMSNYCADPVLVICEVQVRHGCGHHCML